jgi:hypothetical protein
MDKEETAKTIKWLGNIPLSKGTGKLEKDFSDGVKMAELLKYYYPRYVDLHNYSPVLKRESKVNNWDTLNRKVLSKLDIRISDSMTDRIVSGKKGEILNLLTEIRQRILETKEGQLKWKNDSKYKNKEPCSDENKNDNVDYSALLKKKDQQLSEKEELIKTLTQTVSNLEIQLQLKNKDIKDRN